MSASSQNWVSGIEPSKEGTLDFLLDRDFSLYLLWYLSIIYETGFVAATRKTATYIKRL